MNTAPESINQLEQQAYDYGYRAGKSTAGKAHICADELRRLITAVNMLPPSWRNAIDDSVSRAGKAYDDYIKSITTSA